MSLHPSLKTKAAGLNQHRNVLTRVERVAKLIEKGEFDKDKDTPLGMRKVGNRQLVTKKKAKKQDDESDS